MIAAVFGSSGGIGRAMTEETLRRGGYDRVFAISRSGQKIAGADPLKADFLDEADLHAVAETLGTAGPVALCVVANGLLSDGASLQPEKSWRHQSAEAFQRVLMANTVAPALIAKHVLPLTPRNGRSVFTALSARVGSISDNRLGGWHAYRASKAALNMLMRNYAIEQARRAPEGICVSLHPGTVDTALSRPFRAGGGEGKLFKPAQAAEFLMNVIEGLSPADTGKRFDWAGKEIPA